MKAELLRQTFGDNDGFKILNVSWCCDKLKENPLLEWSDEYRNKKGFPTPASLCHSRTVGSWGDDFEINDYYEIDYCPFCGKPIEISVTKEEDMTDIFQKLVNQRDELWGKCQQTDSKKKEVELRGRVHRLDDEIDSFYKFSDYKELKGTL